MMMKRITLCVCKLYLFLFLFLFVSNCVSICLCICVPVFVCLDVFPFLRHVCFFVCCHFFNQICVPFFFSFLHRSQNFHTSMCYFFFTGNSKERLTE